MLLSLFFDIQFFAIPDPLGATDLCSC